MRRSRAIGGAAKVVCLCLLAGLLGCNTGGGYRAPAVKHAAQSSRGAAIDVVMQTGEELQGELLAIENDVIYIELAQSGQIVSVFMGTTKETSVRNYVPHATTLLVWGALGGLTTISHGFILLLTGPLWLLTTGTASGLHVGLTGRSSVPEAKWARYPQGMPSRLRDKAVPLGTPRGIPFRGPRPPAPDGPLL